MSFDINSYVTFIIEPAIFQPLGTPVAPVSGCADLQIQLRVTKARSLEQVYTKKRKDELNNG
jgi:hypothetical protein